MSKRDSKIDSVMSNIECLKADNVPYMTWFESYIYLNDYEVATLPNDLYWNLANCIVKANVSIGNDVDIRDFELLSFMHKRKDSIDRKIKILSSHINFIQNCYKQSNGELDKNAALCAIFSNNRENELTEAQRNIFLNFINIKYGKQHTINGFNLALPTIGVTEDSKYVVGLSYDACHVNYGNSCVYKKVGLETPYGIKDFDSVEELDAYLIQQISTSDEKGGAIK